MSAPGHLPEPKLFNAAIFFCIMLQSPEIAPASTWLLHSYNRAAGEPPFAMET